MRASVYVDGFNLYYGALKGTPYKWLDLRALARRLAPTYEIERIRYCTAWVKPTAHDPHQRERQEVLIRALESRGVTVHFGFFDRHPKRMPLKTAVPPDTPGVKNYPDGSQSIMVVKTEEKGSDVNLGAYMLRDAFRGELDCAVVVSNDGDLKAPVEIIREELGLHVIVINPQRGKRPSSPLFAACSEHRDLQLDDLLLCQLPDELLDSEERRIHRPPSWA